MEESHLSFKLTSGQVVIILFWVYTSSVLISLSFLSQILQTDSFRSQTRSKFRVFTRTYFRNIQSPLLKICHTRHFRPQLRSNESIDNSWKHLTSTPVVQSEKVRSIKPKTKGSVSYTEFKEIESLETERRVSPSVSLSFTSDESTTSLFLLYFSDLDLAQKV